jgi:hypothetical protein
MSIGKAPTEVSAFSPDRTPCGRLSAHTAFPLTLCEDALSESIF